MKKNSQHTLGVSNRAVYIKTGNSLHNDIEYYEYTIPVVSQLLSSFYHPTRATQSRMKQQHVMSEFAKSAYMTASPISKVGETKKWRETLPPYS